MEIERLQIQIKDTQRGGYGRLGRGDGAYLPGNFLQPCSCRYCRGFLFDRQMYCQRGNENERIQPHFRKIGVNFFFFRFLECVITQENKASLA